MTDWKRKLAACLHDPPEKVLDLAWHKKRAENYEAGLALEDTEFARDCDHTAAAADRLPWPRWQFLESAFDGRNNHFKHPLGGKTSDGQPVGFRINPYSHADIAHHFASLNRPQLAQGDDRAQFFAFWRLWHWWASDQRDPRLAFLPADTRLPDHTIWVHNSIVSALEACVTGEGRERRCRPAFLLFQIGPVQDYIAQARRTLDLWSGSYLLSYLVGCGLRHIALQFGPDNVIFPNLCGQPIFDLLLKEEVWSQARVQLESSGADATLWDGFGYEKTKDGQPNDYGRRRLLTPSLPNRFLAVLPADQAANVARAVEKEIRDTHTAIAHAVWKWAANHLPSANCCTDENRSRFDAQNQRFLDIAWQVVEWPDFPDQAFELTKILPDAQRHESDDGPRAGLHTILEMARKMPRDHRDHRDVRNFECERFPDGTRDKNGRDISGWKDRSKLQPDAKLDNPGAAWSALYQLCQWQLDAVRQTRAWQAWTAGGWEVGRDRNKDSLNGKEEALLDVRGPAWDETKVTKLNGEAKVPNLFKTGELLGASSLIKRLWPTAWLQAKHGFSTVDWRMPDTRHMADSQPFARSDKDDDFDADAERAEDRDANKYFAVLALDGDEMGKWISGLHPNMPKLGDQLSDYVEGGERKGARKYFEDFGLKDLLERKRPLSPSFHLQFSEMLANFGNFCVRRIVEAHDGRLIYSGGDDVLALLPAHTAIACARALRAAFRGEVDALNGLTGAWRYRNGEWTKEEVKLFQCEQPGFIRLSPEAPALEGEPKKFSAIVPGPAADCSVGLAIGHFKSPLQDVVREAQRAEKRAKKELGRSAVAVTLIKRSGETIQWGCQWDSGGLEAYSNILAALQADIVSAKFPHRIVQLVEAYQTDQPGRLGGTKPADGFDSLALEILRRDIAIAADRQRGKKYSREEVAKISDALTAYLTNLHGAPTQVDALIGLCQTVAFAHRARDDGGDLKSAISNPQSAIERAERQPA